MNTLLHLTAVLSSLWASIFAFQTLEEPALGGAMLVLFFGFVAMTVAALDDDLFLITGRKLLGFRGNQREGISVTSKVALVAAIIFLFISTFFSSFGTSTGTQNVAVLSSIAIGEDDTADTTPQAVNRVGALFESRPRRSVDEGDDVGFLVDNHGRQYVRAEIAEPLTAFGEVSVAELTPIIQLQFPYAVNPRLITSLTAGSGAASITNSLLTVSTGTTTASDVLLRSVADAKYHPGQGTLARWTAVFDSSGTAGTEVVSGFGNEEDGFFSGYDGATFGFLHRKEGSVEHRTLTFTTGAVTAGGTITITLNGTATEVEVVNGDSVQAVARAVGAVTFARWEVLVIGDAVIFTAHLAEAKASTFSLVDTDTTGVAATAGLVQSITGVAPTDTWIPQSTWNADKMDGSNDSGTNPSKMTFVPSNGNVFQVQFQWLGFGEIIFAIENENTGRFHVVHRIAFANNNTTPSIQNPTLPLYLAVKNGSTTTNVSVSSSSMAVFTEGIINEAGPSFSVAGTFSGTATTEQSILCVINKPIFQSKENRIDVAGQLLTLSANGAGAAKFHTFRVTVNPILGGDPSFTDISTATSVMAFDTAGTTLTGGSVVGTFEFGKTVDNFALNLTTFTILQPPETLICFSVQTDGGTTDADVGFIWQEMF